MGTASSIPIQLDPQPHWKIATTTPYAAPTESRFIAAAFSPIASDRNAAVSRISDIRTTAKMRSGNRSITFEVKSTDPAVVPVTRVSTPLTWGSTESRRVLTRSVVFWSCGPVVGTTVIVAVLPALLSCGADASATPAVFRSEEHTSELQSLRHLVCRLLLE